MRQRENTNPLYDGVYRGRGGRAGGKFLWTNDDETPSSVVATGTAQAAGGVFLSLPGTSGSYASTPDSAALSITGDLELEFEVTAANWTPAATQLLLAKDDSASGRAYWLSLNTDGTLTLFWTEDGSTVLAANSGVATGVADGSKKRIKVTLDVDNGASGRDIQFFLSANGSPWTQLGSTVTQAGVTSIHDSAVALTLGTYSGADALLFDGQIHYVIVRNGIDGTVAARFDPATDAETSLVNAFTSSTGEAWQINGSAVLKLPFLQLASSASSVDDFYNGYALEITRGTGSGQDHQRIVDYDGTTKTAYVSGKWTTTPDSTSTYRIVNRGN